MVRFPETIEFEKLFDAEQLKKILYVGVDGIPIYDDNGVEAFLSYGFDYPYVGGRDLSYDTDILVNALLEVTDNSGDNIAGSGESLMGEIKSLEFTLDGETYLIEEPFNIQGQGSKSKSALYIFMFSKSVFDAFITSKTRSLKVYGKEAFFNAIVDSEVFRIYTLLFSKLADKWKDILSKSTDSCLSIFPDSCSLNEELKGDKDLEHYVILAQQENESKRVGLHKAAMDTESKEYTVAEAEANPVKPKAKTGSLIKEAETLRKKYNKSLTTYSIPRYEAVYKSGYVISEIGANKVIDVGFYNNPNLDNQFTPNVGGSGGSGVLGALQEAAAESYAEKKKNEAIEKASKESSATFVLYAVPQDPDHFKMDIVFSNRSKNRAMENPGLHVDPSYTSSEIKGTTHKSRPGNYFEDVMTVSFPFDYLYSIKGKEATFVFDQEQEDGNDAVVLKFIVRYDLMDLITVDYLVRGEYWEQSMRDCYEPMLIKNAQLYLQSNSIDSVEKKDEETENTYKGIGCISALAVTVLVAIVLGNLFYTEGWPIAIGLALGIAAYYFINKKGKDKTKLSRRESASKAAILKKDIAYLKRDFATTYSNHTKE